MTEQDISAAALVQKLKALGHKEKWIADAIGSSQPNVNRWSAGSEPSDARVYLRLKKLVEDETAKAANPETAPPEVRPVDNADQTISEIDAYAGAGGGGITVQPYDHNGVAWIGEAIRDKWMIPEAIISGMWRSATKYLTAFEVIGDSMLPTLNPGDRVFVDTRRREPNPEGIFVLFDGDSIVVKSLQIIRGSDPLMVRVISDNPKYPPYEALAEDIRIIGRYVGRFTTS